MASFSKKWPWILAVLGLLIPLLQPVMPDIVSDYRLFLVSTMIIAAIAVLGLNLLTGFNGQFSLGHGAFYAVGAYTAAVLMDKLNVPYWATVPAAAIVCFMFGYLFGLPALKLEGHYLALATFALALAVPQILKYKWLEGVTGGVQGIVLLKPEPPFGLPLSEDQWLFYFCFITMIVLYWAAANLLDSRSGRAMMAIRDQYMAADTMGIDTALYKTVTFGISAAYTGIAGALSASAIAFVAPDSFNIFLSIKFLIGLVVGGIGSLAGSVIGGIFYVLVDNSAQSLTQFIRNDLGLPFDLSAYTVFGVLLIAIIYLMPMGIAGGVYLAWRKLRGVRG
ncbi:MAG: branched-chain amino acid ABC transporter permease [Rhodospirillaceae bacterium]|nr:branched-chain amino acid ABC transporter permease [Rhodospirillaceae bacterium]